MSYSENLPSEIIRDILSRLPVKSLFRFKCVSSLWKSLISDPHFAKTHLDRTKTTNYPERKIVAISHCGNLNLVDYKEVNTTTSTKLEKPTVEQNDAKDWYKVLSCDGSVIFSCSDKSMFLLNPTPTKLEFPAVEQIDAERWVKVLSTSCDGLVLVSRSDDSIFLLNPSTRECKKLPICPFPNPLNINLNLYGVGYDSSTDDYKVLMLSYTCPQHWSTITDVAVYSLKTNAWRRIEDSQYQFSGEDKHLFTGCKIGGSGVVFHNGCLYFLWNRTFCCFTLISFDLSSEIVREMPLPSSLYKNNYLMVVLGGSLSLVNTVTGEVLMMKEYEAKEYSWTKFTKFTMDSGDSINTLWMLAEDEYMLLENKADGWKELIVCNPHKFTKRVIFRTPNSFGFWATYVETLISPFHA